MATGRQSLAAEHPQTFRSWPSQKGFLITCFMILPVGLMGSSSTNATDRGFMYEASVGGQKFSFEPK